MDHPYMTSAAAQSTKNLDSKPIILGSNTTTDGDQGSKTKTSKIKHHQGKKASSLSVDIDHVLVTKSGKTDNACAGADLATKSFLNS